MTEPSVEDDASSLERARQRLYTPNNSAMDIPRVQAYQNFPHARTVPHAWQRSAPEAKHVGRRHVRYAAIFFGISLLFFIIALGVAGYFLYYGGNSVSVNKITVTVQGPTTIAGGDTVPLSFTITNKNPVALQNATIEIDFPPGTRSADDIQQSDPRFIQTIGTIASGATYTGSASAVVFGSAGQSLPLQVSLTYSAAGSNAVFVKSSSYPLTISSTPLSVSVDTLAQTNSGAPLTLTLNVRSNTTVPLDNVVVTGTFPFGFTVASSSIPLTNSSFLIGTLAPGASETITLTGTLTGQDQEQTAFNFTVGTAAAPDESTLAVTYMTQSADVTIAAPLISTSLAVNGNTSTNPTVTAGSQQTVTIAYTNTLSTSITNPTISVMISGSPVDYNSIQSSTGFYQSSNQTISFDHDTDPTLASLAPGASGTETFTFNTLPSSPTIISPTITLTVSVSGTPVGQSNVPQAIASSETETVSVATGVALTVSSLQTSGPFTNTGPLPPKANEPTTYTIEWNAQDEGSAVAGGTVSTTLPSYVSYTGKTSGDGSISYDSASRTVTWSTGDLPQGGSAQAAFQVSFTPSTSQVGTTPSLTTNSSFSGYDRFAGVQVSASADPVTIMTSDPGYSSTDGTVQ